MEETLPRCSNQRDEKVIRSTVSKVNYYFLSILFLEFVYRLNHRCLWLFCLLCALSVVDLLSLTSLCTTYWMLLIALKGIFSLLTVVYELNLICYCCYQFDLISYLCFQTWPYWNFFCKIKTRYLLEMLNAIVIRICISCFNHMMIFVTHQ